MIKRKAEIELPGKVWDTIDHFLQSNPYTTTLDSFVTELIEFAEKGISTPGSSEHAWLANCADPKAIDSAFLATQNRD
ncbi:MAG: hypothetical protein AB8B55_00290 [Mariniblastus sp.]